MFTLFFWTDGQNDEVSSPSLLAERRSNALHCYLFKAELILDCHAPVIPPPIPSSLPSPIPRYTPAGGELKSPRRPLQHEPNVSRQIITAAVGLCPEQRVRSKKSELSSILWRTPECGGEDVSAFGAEGQTQQRVDGSRLTKYQLLHSVLPRLTSGIFFPWWRSKPRPHRLFRLRLAFSGGNGKKSGADRNRLQLL